VSIQPPADDWSAVFEADNLSSRVAVLRQLVRRAADRDTAALQLLLGMLPAVDALLADVQGALTPRNRTALLGLAVWSSGSGHRRPGQSAAATASGAPCLHLVGMQDDSRQSAKFWETGRDLGA
jgi:hypothetical protein